MIADNANVVHTQIMICLCVLTSIAQHNRWATIRLFNTMSQGIAVDSVVLEVETPRKTHRQQTAHRPDSLVGRNFASLNLSSGGTCPTHLASRKKMANLPKETHPVKNSRQHQRTCRAGQETRRGQDQRNRLRYATVRLQTTVPQVAEEQTERLLCGSQR